MATYDAKDIGQPNRAAIALIREASGVTIYELADWLDIAPQLLIKIEKGKRWMPKEAVVKLTKILGRDGLFHSPYTKPSRIILSS